MPKIIDELGFRKLAPVECERLQTVPDNYTSHVSNTQRYKMLGNGWTVDVIVHILKSMKYDKENRKRNKINNSLFEPFMDQYAFNI